MDRLNGLPADLPSSDELVDNLVQFVQEDQLFTGEVWSRDGLEEFIIETYLPEHLEAIDLDYELKDVIAQTNAIFYDVEWDYAEVQETENRMTITAFGKYLGDHDEESGKPFTGDTIDLEVVIDLERVAGWISFEEPEVTVTGEVDCQDLDADDPDMGALSEAS
jgi:hypothetical protein